MGSIAAWSRVSSYLQFMTTVLLLALSDASVFYPNAKAMGFGHILTHRDSEKSSFARKFSSIGEQLSTYHESDLQRISNYFKPRQNATSKKLSKGPQGTYRQTLTSYSTVYFVEVWIGQPPQKQTLIWDTGSDLIWVKGLCSPKSCDSQLNRQYSPAKSKTYSRMSCRSHTCKTSGVQAKHLCAGSAGQCRYENVYGSGYSTGLLAFDTFTTGLYKSRSSLKLPSVVFGVGRMNVGFAGVDGLMGAARSPLSFPNQIAAFSENVFSACLTAKLGGKSQVLYGPASVPTSGVSYTPIVSNVSNIYYNVQVTGVKVGRTVVSIPSKVWKNSDESGTIFDSGTTFGYINSLAFDPIFAEVKRQAKLPPRETYLDFSPCFALRGANNSTINLEKYLPKIVFEFEGNAKIVLSPNIYVLPVGPFTICNTIFSLPSGYGWDINILGTVFQQNLLVVYDQSRNRLGFKPTDCSTGKPL